MGGKNQTADPGSFVLDCLEVDNAMGEMDNGQYGHHGRHETIAKVLIIQG